MTRVSTSLCVALMLAACSASRASDESPALTYTGSLIAAGRPDNDTHEMSIALYLPQSDARAVCASAVQSVKSTEGKFTIVLPPSCASVVQHHPDVLVQVTVDSVQLPREPLNAGESTDDEGEAVPAPTCLLPAGTVIEFAGRTPPAGFLACDGRAVPRAEYAKLFAVIGTTFGAGDGSATFNLPESRAEGAANAAAFRKIIKI